MEMTFSRQFSMLRSIKSSKKNTVSAVLSNTSFGGDFIQKCLHKSKERGKLQKNIIY